MDVTSKSGGKLHMVLSICKYLKKIKNYNFVFITTFQNAKTFLDNELEINSLFFDKNDFKNKLFNKIKKKFNFLPLNFPLYNFLKKHDIDLIYFLDSSPLIRSIQNIKFIYTIFDLGHRNFRDFPEYDENEVLKREADYLEAGLKSSKIIVGTDKLKEQVSENYTINKDKIEVLKFPPPITNLNKNDDVEIDSNVIQIIKKRNYFLYPAQFWKHKNHSYIINASHLLKKNDELKFKFVFTGYDKGNLENIKKQINHLELKSEFLILDYVSNLELKLLYQNCTAVVVPTLVAPHTFPLYEAFYFKKPILYNSHILDPEFKRNVIGLNVDDIHDLRTKIKKLKDVSYTEELVNYNFKCFNDYFNEDIILDKLNKIFSSSLGYK